LPSHNTMTAARTSRAHATHVADEHRAAPSRREDTAEIVGTPCIDGTALSVADVQRTAEKLAAQRERLRKAIYAVAGQVEDAEECRRLFEIIGIDLASVRAVRESRPRAGRRPESDAGAPLA
jgi:hypothetical protein